jgi:hypothetical protein
MAMSGKVAAFAVMALCIGGAPAQADEQALDYLARHGCTQAASEVGASWDEGFPVAQVEDYVSGLVRDGLAAEQGAFVVLDPSVCTVRLPQIETTWRLDAPEILALTSAVDAYSGQPGCFLRDISGFFSERYEDPVRALDEYSRFLAAHLLSGDVRFFSASPLVTPVGWQVMTGACAEVPEADDIAASHTYISDASFAGYIAHLRENDTCFADHMGSAGDAARVVQGIDLATGEGPEGAPFNAFLDLEYMVITLAMGWRLGASMEDRGLSRPPLCAWP